MDIQKMDHKAIFQKDFFVMKEKQAMLFFKPSL